MEYSAIGVLTRSQCIEHGVPDHKIRIIHNFIDTDRFKPREALPATPKRALVFSNNATRNSRLEAVSTACRRVGLRLDVRGIGSGAPEKSPETVLGSYDIVFARGRSPLEAMAIGTAVVLCDKEGAGPMVDSTHHNARRLRNFGCTTLGLMPSPGVLLDQISRYDPEDALRVSNRIRSEAALACTVPSIVGMYREAVAQWARSTPDPHEESLALARYVRMISDFVKVSVNGQKAPAQPQRGRVLNSRRWWFPSGVAKRVTGGSG
jgi:hypothetical protein